MRWKFFFLNVKKMNEKEIGKKMNKLNVVPSMLNIYKRHPHNKVFSSFCASNSWKNIQIFMQ